MLCQRFWFPSGLKKGGLEDLRKERANLSEIARNAFLAERAKMQLKEFKQKMAKAEEAAKKLSKTSRTVREFREAG